MKKQLLILRQLRNALSQLNVVEIGLRDLGADEVRSKVLEAKIALYFAEEKLSVFVSLKKRGLL